MDIFRPVPMFTDRTGEGVNPIFAYAKAVAGAEPRMSKTFLLRQMLLDASCSASSARS